MSKKKKLKKMLETMREYRRAQERARERETMGGNLALRLCSMTELPGEGQAKEFAASGKAICVAMQNGKATAMDNVCPHRGASLSEGSIEDGKLVCPWHGWAFRLSDGGADGMANERVQLYQLYVAGDDVLIDL